MSIMTIRYLATLSGLVAFQNIVVCDGMIAGLSIVRARVNRMKPWKGMSPLPEGLGSINSPDFNMRSHTKLEFRKQSMQEMSEQGPNEWVNLGISAVYLAHFASMYTQLPGLFGRNGILPISQRPFEVANTWAIDILPFFPEKCIEEFAALGILVAATQLAWKPFRLGPLGVLSYALLWVFWHDLVIAGGRFTSYQMDYLLLDAAPLAVLSASGISPRAVNLGYRWLLSRLYLGAGAVKLLSCDGSWRDLSAIHWHFQSQPLPNPLGAYAYKNVPNHPIGELLTLAVIVIEMAAPFLFLAPSKTIRRFAFGLNVLLMVGIMTFGNFGPLQILLLIIGIALLDEDDLRPLGKKEIVDKTADKLLFAETETSDYFAIHQTVTALSVSLALWASLWSAYNIVSPCNETWGPGPLVYGAITLSFATLFSLVSVGSSKVTNASIGAIVIAGSIYPLAQGLNVALPVAFANVDNLLNIGATPYGLFAVMTGSDGTRPVFAIEAAASADGPWIHLPLMYQVNDPSSPLPLCFPHFPRLDWTLWFLPLGESGKQWLGKFIYELSTGEAGVINLIDAPAFRQAFPEGPPEFFKLTAMPYALDPTGAGWQVVANSEIPSRFAGVFSRKELSPSLLFDDSFPSWPGLLIVRNIADAIRPEHFIWMCFVTSELGRRVLVAADHSKREVEIDE